MGFYGRDYPGRVLGVEPLVTNWLKGASVSDANRRANIPTINGTTSASLAAVGGGSLAAVLGVRQQGVSP